MQYAVYYHVGPVRMQGFALRFGFSIHNFGANCDIAKILNAFIRFPLEANELDYEFGNEYEVHFGINYPLPILDRRVSLLLSLDYLYAEHDKAFQPIVPPRLLDGVKVLNTGGSFLDLTPGFSIQLTKKTAVTARTFLPVSQDWNGDRSRTPPVGQVAQDITGQITLVALF